MPPVPRTHCSRPSCQLVQFTQRCAYTTSSENQTLRLQSGKKESKAYLLTDPLPAKLALDRMFNDRIARRPPVDKRNGIQRDADADEVEDLVDEITELSQAEKSENVSIVPFFEPFTANLIPFPTSTTSIRPKKKKRKKEK